MTEFTSILCRAAAAVLILLAPTIGTSQNRDFQAERLILDDNGGNTVTIATPAGMTGDWTFILPPAAPTGAGQTLVSDGSGGFAWQTPSGGGGIPAGYMILSESPTVPSGFTASGALVSDFWESRAAMTTPRRGMVSGVVNGKIYVIGGADGNTLLATN